MDARSVGIIGLEEEFKLIVRSLEKGIPVILEGEAGTGKTEIGKVAARVLGRQLYRVDGDQELSALKLQGWFDPPLVLSKGYNWESFVPGPLTEAMTHGGIFFFNEINRAPSEAINGLLTALDERLINIPRLGTIKADDEFTSIFTSNPFDRVGTNPLPQAFFDRCVWIGVDHLPLEEAGEVVHLRTGENDESLIKIMCKIVEGSRKHPDVVSGGSVRAAIFMVKLAQAYRQKDKNPCERETLVGIAKCALWKKIKLRYDSELSQEEVVDDVVDQVLGISSRRRGKPIAGYKNKKKRGTSFKIVRKDKIVDFNLTTQDNETESEDLEEGGSWDCIFKQESLSLAMVKKYRKRGKKVSWRLRRKLFQMAVEALRKEGRIIASKGGIITKKTEVLPYKPGTEWDLDLSLDRMLASSTYKLPSYRDLVRWELIRSRRCFVILADKSNSLGPAIDYVAMAVSVAAEAVREEEYAVLLFNDSVKVVKPMRSFVDEANVLEEILNIECFGATNLHLAFEMAGKQLEASPPGTEGICVLISDCIPTVGRDPLEAVNVLPKMEVLLLRNESIIIGSSYADKLEPLPQVKVREIRQLNDIIDAIQDIVSYGSLEMI